MHLRSASLRVVGSKGRCGTAPNSRALGAGGAGAGNTSRHAPPSLVPRHLDIHSGTPDNRGCPGIDFSTGLPVPALPFAQRVVMIADENQSAKAAKGFTLGSVIKPAITAQVTAGQLANARIDGLAILASAMHHDTGIGGMISSTYMRRTVRSGLCIPRDRRLCPMPHRSVDRKFG